MLSVSSSIEHRVCERFEQGPNSLRFKGGKPYIVTGCVAACSSTATVTVHANRISLIGHPNCVLPESQEASVRRVALVHQAVYDYPFTQLPEHSRPSRR